MEDLIEAAVLLRAPGYDDVSGPAGCSGTDLAALAADTELVTMAGGMSNAMYCLERKSSGIKLVTRVVAAELPPGSNDLDQDLLMRSLASDGREICPASYGVQQTRHGLVRIEQFTKGDTMIVEQFRQNDTALKMGCVIGTVHSIDPIRSGQLPDKLCAQAGRQPNMLVGRLLTYSQAMRGSHATPSDLHVDWSKEAGWMSSLLQAVAHPSQLPAQLLPPATERTVLVHCDGQPGNWLYSGIGSTGLTLIDWEYACFAPFPSGVGFDLGNAMNEYTLNYGVQGKPGFQWTGLREERGLGYPPVHWQRAYIYAWARSAGLLPASDAGIVVGDMEGSTQERTSISPAVLEQHFPEPVLRAAALCGRVGILNGHLFWAMWSFLLGSGRKNKALHKAAERMTSGTSTASTRSLASMPSADSPMASTPTAQSTSSGSALPASGHSSFDYEEYGRLRWAEYCRLKAQVCADAPALYELAGQLAASGTPQAVETRAAGVVYARAALEQSRSSSRSDSETGAGILGVHASGVDVTAVMSQAAALG